MNKVNKLQEQKKIRKVEEKKPKIMIALMRQLTKKKMCKQRVLKKQKNIYLKPKNPKKI